MRRLALALVAILLLRADMYPDASNAKLPEARNNILGTLAADSTGAANVQAAVQAAITAACVTTSPLPVVVPPGTYKFLTNVTIPAGCHGFRMSALEPGAATFVADIANAGAQAQILRVAGARNVEVRGIRFDGNAIAGNTNDNPMLRVDAPSHGFQFVDSEVTNTYGSAMDIVGGARITGQFGVDQPANQPVLNFAGGTMPPGIKPGAQVIMNLIDPNVYVTAVGASTVTLSENLSDTIPVNVPRSAQFTPSFVSSAATRYGDLVIPTTDTSGLAVGQTIYSNTKPQCVQSNTSITAIATNASVTIDRKIICDIASGDLIAAIAGNSNVLVANSTFSEIGQQMIAGCANNIDSGCSQAVTSYNTVGVQASGQPNLTLACISGTGCTRAGLVPGQKTGLTGLPAGVPANTLITGGPTSIDTPSGSYTVRLAANLTAAVPTGTAIPVQTSRAGRGYGVWYSFGAWFSNRDSRFIDNKFHHIWVAPLFPRAVGYLLLQGNNYVMDGMEYVDPNVAPSPCVSLAINHHILAIGEYCKGSSGNGYEVTHSTNVTISGSQFVEHGKVGVQICSGKNIAVGGGSLFRNNGQYKNRPFTTNQDELGQSTAGLKLTGSCTSGQIGTQTNTSVDNIVTVDDQPTPTQEWGIGWRNADAGFVGLRLGGSITGSGNISALVDPTLLPYSEGWGLTGSLGGAPLAAGACTSGTVAVPGATTAMAATASPVTYPGDGIYWRGYVSAPGTVTVSVCAAVAGTPAASAYNVRVER